MPASGSGKSCLCNHPRSQLKPQCMDDGDDDDVDDGYGDGYDDNDGGAEQSLHTRQHTLPPPSTGAGTTQLSFRAAAAAAVAAVAAAPAQPGNAVGARAGGGRVGALVGPDDGVFDDYALFDYLLDASGGTWAPAPAPAAAAAGAAGGRGAIARPPSPTRPSPAVTVAASTQRLAHTHNSHREGEIGQAPIRVHNHHHTDALARPRHRSDAQVRLFGTTLTCLEMRPLRGVPPTSRHANQLTIPPTPQVRPPGNTSGQGTFTHIQTRQPLPPDPPPLPSGAHLTRLDVVHRPLRPLTSRHPPPLRPSSWRRGTCARTRPRRRRVARRLIGRRWRRRRTI